MAVQTRRIYTAATLLLNTQKLMFAGNRPFRSTKANQTGSFKQGTNTAQHPQTFKPAHDTTSTPFTHLGLRRRGVLPASQTRSLPSSSTTNMQRSAHIPSPHMTQPLVVLSTPFTHLGLRRRGVLAAAPMHNNIAQGRCSRYSCKWSLSALLFTHLGLHRHGVPAAAPMRSHS
jgi:hypothetical protein